jgi:release factor glutamine methyltransferase
MSSTFESKDIESPRLISEMLLTHVLGGQRIELYANVHRVTTDGELGALRELVKRALEHEPVQYLVGKTWFNGMEFNVNPSTLIPRTCTETIVDQVLARMEDTSESFRVADIGTGSGCISISIAANSNSSEITAIDISEEALRLAKENASLHGVENQISFILGDGIAPLRSLEPFDIICSNPPYIPDAEMETLAPNVKNWEPTLALSGGSDGLHLIAPMLRDAPQCILSGGMLLIELATSKAEEVLRLAQENLDLEDCKILRDRFGDNRFLRATRR